MFSDTAYVCQKMNSVFSVHSCVVIIDFNTIFNVFTRNPQRPSSVDISGSVDIAEWNPFGDDNFSNMNEDSLFGREFDRIRRKGSNSSNFNSSLM